MSNNDRICVVIPCFKVRNSILNVIKKINFKIIDKVIIVDDCCPERRVLNLIQKKLKNLIILKNKKILV